MNIVASSNDEVIVFLSLLNVALTGSKNFPLSFPATFPWVFEVITNLLPLVNWLVEVTKVYVPSITGSSISPPCFSLTTIPLYVVFNVPYWQITLVVPLLNVEAYVVASNHWHDDKEISLVELSL